MKFYIAGKFQKRDRVREIQQVVKEEGYEIVVDWTRHKDIDDYSESQLTPKYAEEDVKGAKACDIFVLISGKGRGCHLELGAALASDTEEIFVIGEDRKDCLFYFHPGVKRRKGIEEVLEELH